MVPWEARNYILIIEIVLSRDYLSNRTFDLDLGAWNLNELLVCTSWETCV